MARITYTGDPVHDIRLATERLIQQRVSSINANIGIEASPRQLSPTNPQMGGVDQTYDLAFATGYSGGVTTLALTFDISAFGGPDEFTDF